ncbi:unnamed protein product [Urochloa decumbens]|uniref:SANTA domain-containing protein n=1 Tax=Urochloa decumbens TaxID=240449 RepID=A0ABC9CAN2_9POAL
MVEKSPPQARENPIEMHPPQTSIAPPQTPIPPWGSNRRRKMPPSVLSPSFSRRPFLVTASAAAAAGGDQDANVSEHPCVTLLEWWLARVEGDDKKIAVAGVFERNQTTNEFGPARIAKRHESCVLESEDGIVLCICGSLNITRTLAYGYSIQVCEKFMIGFPYWWENCNQLYPKETSSHGGHPPTFSNGRNSNVDSTKFYLEQFQLGERLHSYGSAMLSKLSSVKSSNDAAFQKSSHLPNGAPRFEEYTSDDNIVINENVAASNDDGERHEAACNEVYSVDIHLIAGRALGERDDAINTDASLVLTVDVANDASNEGASTPTSDQRKAQHVALSEKAAVNEDVPTAVCLNVQNSYLPSGTPRFEEYTCDGDIAIIENAAASNGDGERDEAVCNEVDNVETVLTSAVECANDANNEEADNAPSTSDKRSPMVSLKTQGCFEKTQHITLSKKAVINDEMPTSVCLDVQNSSDLSKETPRFEKNTYAGDIPTNGDGAASNDNSERCTAVPKEVDRIETSLVVDSTIRERGHDGITNVSLSPTVECTNDAVSEGVHNNSLLGCKQTPVASLKSQGCQKKHQHTSSNEKPSGLPKKRRSALELLQRPRSSPLTSPVPYAHVSPLTRDSAASLSMSTPEALKLKRTRSGRVVVPALNSGYQRIVYDKDGMVTGVVGLGSPSPKGSKLNGSATKKRAEPAAASKLKTSPQKKRSAEPAAASKLKTYARKKRSAEPAAASKLKTYARKKRRAE